MDITLVQNPEHDVDGDERRENQPRLVRQRSLEGLGCALKTPPNTGRQADLLSSPLDRCHRVTERVARREIERERDGRELSLTTHDQRHGCFRDLRKHIQRNLAAVQGPDIEKLQRLWTLLKLWHHFQNDRSEEHTSE